MQLHVMYWRTHSALCAVLQFITLSSGAVSTRQLLSAHQRHQLLLLAPPAESLFTANADAAVRSASRNASRDTRSLHRTQGPFAFTALPRTDLILPPPPQPQSTTPPLLHLFTDTELFILEFPISLREVQIIRIRCFFSVVTQHSLIC